MQFILRDNNGVMISILDSKVFSIKDLETLTTKATKKFDSGAKDCLVFNNDFSLKIQSGTIFLWKDWYLSIDES